MSMKRNIQFGVFYGKNVMFQNFILKLKRYMIL